MKAQSLPTLVVQKPLPNKTIWSFQGLIRHLANVQELQIEFGDPNSLKLKLNRKKFKEQKRDNLHFQRYFSLEGKYERKNKSGVKKIKEKNKRDFW
jgi:hypothetical protein